MMDLDTIRNKLIALRQDGHGYVNIAQVVGLTHPTVLRFLKTDKGVMFDTARKLNQYVDGDAESKLIEKTLIKRSKGLK